MMSIEAHDEKKKTTGRPRKYATPPKVRSIAMHDDVSSWLNTTSDTTGIPVSTLINGIIRSYILAAGSDVHVLPSWPVGGMSMTNR